MRIEQLTFTRFLAALGVVYYHFGKDTALYKFELLTSLFAQANVAVSYFFILSGFVMTVAYQNKNLSPLGYYQNRFARIYPLFFFALMLFLLSQYLSKNSINLYEVFVHLFALQAWIPGYPLSLNFTGWSLSVEFFFYLLFPFLTKYYFDKTTNTKLSLGVILFWFASQIVLIMGLHCFHNSYQSNIHDVLYFNPLMHLNEFLIGILGAKIYLYLNAKGRFTYSWLVILLCCVLFYVMINYHIPYISYHNGFLGIVFLPLIIFLSLDKSLISKIFTLKPFVFLGEISYGIYILQVPVYILAQQIFDKLGLAYSFNRYLFVLLAFSSLSFMLIERPLRNLLTKKKRQ